MLRKIGMKFVLPAEVASSPWQHMNEDMNEKRLKHYAKKLLASCLLLDYYLRLRVIYQNQILDYQPMLLWSLGNK
jgi:hypothetical protein